MTSNVRVQTADDRLSDGSSLLSTGVLLLRSIRALSHSLLLQPFIQKRTQGFFFFFFFDIFGAK